MKLRAMQNGRLVEFEHRDEGEVAPGVFLSMFTIYGIDYPSGSPAASRLENDAKFLIGLGFELGTLDYWDGSQWVELDRPAVSLAPKPAAIMPGAITYVSKPIVSSGTSTWNPAPRPVASFNRTTGLRQISNAHSTSLPRLLRPDPEVGDTMGWRSWLWHDGYKLLVSPHYETLWESAELSAAHWSDDDAVRGVAGIHARLVPRHWKIVGWPDDESSNGIDQDPRLVTGVVERFGRYVMGTEGWRAEQAVIRELMAPNTQIGLELEQRYPDVIVHYPDQVGEVPCESVKSSALGKGSRSLLPNLSPSPSLPSLPAPIRPTPLTFAQIQSRLNPPIIPPSLPVEKPYRPNWELILLGALSGAIFGSALFHILGLLP